jgi:hypothetical protein
VNAPRVSARSQPQKTLRILLGIAFALHQSSCLRTTLRSGKLPGDAAYAWEHRWHHAFFLGQFEGSRPIAPERICPQGWAQIDSELDPLQTAIALITLGIYTPSTVSVICEANERPPLSEENLGPLPKSNSEEISR